MRSTLSDMRALVVNALAGRLDLIKPPPPFSNTQKPGLAESMHSLVYMLVDGLKVRTTSRANFEHLFDNPFDMQFSLGKDGVIADANRMAAMRLGYDRGELIGMRLSELVDANRLLYASGEHPIGLTAHGAALRPAPFRTKDGEPLSVYLVLSVFPEGFGQLREILVTAREIRCDLLPRDKALSNLPVIPRLGSLEVKVFELVAAGKTNKEIGKLMDCNWRTIEEQRNKLKAKLKAKNTAHLVHIGHMVGLLGGKRGETRA